MFDNELSKPHREFISILLQNYYSVSSEFKIEPYTLDIYLSEFHVGVEVDGPAHSKPRDIKRDAFIWDNYAIPIFRVKVKDIHDPEVLVELAEFCEEYSFSLAERLRIYRNVFNKTHGR